MERAIVVLAGNPRVELLHNHFILDPQMRAFDAGVRFVASHRTAVRRIYVAFDHRGVFEAQFLDPLAPAGRKQRKSHICLSYVRPEVRDAYAPGAACQRISLDTVYVITEAQSRMEALRIADPNDARLIGSGCAIDDGSQKYHLDHPRVTCTGILTADIHRLSRHGNDIVTFWEYDEERCNPVKIHNATMIARKMLSLPHTITHYIIFDDHVREFTYFPDSDPVIEDLTDTQFKEKIM